MAYGKATLSGIFSPVSFCCGRHTLRLFIVKIVNVCCVVRAIKHLLFRFSPIFCRGIDKVVSKFRNKEREAITDAAYAMVPGACGLI